MMSKSYWEKRQKRTYLAGEKKVNEYYNELQKAFEQAKKEIQSVINDFYMRYAKENKVSFAEAQKLLDKTEIGDLKAFIDKVFEHMGEYNLELSNMSIKARITRYQALEKQIDAILQQLYAIEYEMKGEELLKEVYSDSYYRTWFNIDRYYGFHQEFAQVNPRTIDELIRYPFNGADFSSRIWKQKDHMLQVLAEDITTMLVQGKNPQTLAEDFAKRFKTKEFEAYRLLHTESSFIIEQGSLAAYKEDGVEKYQILATLDMKTSDICREQDGKVYDVDKATVRVNYPPFHPFCRTTTVPYYEDVENEGTRVARDPKSGKSYEVPANITYEEWYDKYIKNNPEAILTEKKWKNRYADRKQYERYKKVLGKDLGVSSIDDFQNLKYNNTEKWEETQAYYRYKKKYPESNQEYFKINKDIQELISKGVVAEKIGVAVKPIPIDYEKMHKHALKRMAERNLKDQDIKGFIKDAKVMFKQDNDRRNVYYSEKGAAGIIVNEKMLITAFPASSHDEGAKAIMEVLKKHGK